MSTTVVTSKQFTLNLRDAWRGILMAVIAAVLPIAYNALQVWTSGGAFNLDVREIVGTAITALLSYLGLNFFNKSKVITVAPKDEVDAVASQIKRVV